MFYQTCRFFIAAITAGIIICPAAGNVFAADNISPLAIDTVNPPIEAVRAVYGRTKEGSGSRFQNEIYIMRSQQFTVPSNIDLMISIVCIDGYKFTQIITSGYDMISTDLVQMNYQVQGESLPMTCNPAK